MKSNNHIIKDILTKMFYNSRLTLNENKKRIISEECIPTNLKFDNYDPETGHWEKGNPRSIKYPELGNWGDGTCKCEGQCLEFRTDCCKKGSVSADPIEKPTMEFNDDMAYNGSVIKIPKTAKISRVKNCKDYYNQAKKLESESINNVCNNLKNMNMLWSYGFESFEQCVATYKMAKLYSSCKDGGILSFDYEGQTYIPCITLSKKDPVLGKEILRPENVIFSGYFTGQPINGRGCGSIPYNPSNINRIISKDAEYKTALSGEESSKEKSIDGGTSADKSNNENEFFIQF